MGQSQRQEPRSCPASSLQLGRGTAVDVPARRVPCVLGARHAAISKGVGARRSTKDSRKGSLPDPRNAAQRGSAKSAPHEARDHAARLIRAVAAPEAPGHHCTLLCNCRDELPSVARELAGEANAEAGDWWKRAQEGKHRARRAATLLRLRGIKGVQARTGTGLD